MIIYPLGEGEGSAYVVLRTEYPIAQTYTKKQNEFATRSYNLDSEGDLDNPWLYALYPYTIYNICCTNENNPPR